MGYRRESREPLQVERYRDTADVEGGIALTGGNPHRIVKRRA
jgi:hypothetical protein